MGSGNIGTMTIGAKIQTQQLKKDADESRGIVGSLGKSVMGSFATFGLAAEGVKSLFGILHHVIGEPLKLAANLESAGVAFEVLIGNAEEGQKLLKEVKEIGDKTPFVDDKQLFDASKKLLAMGYSSEKVGGQLKNLAQISGAIGTPIDELAGMMAKVQDENILTERSLKTLQKSGVPVIEALAEVMGVGRESIKDMVAGGQVEFKHLEAAISNLTNGNGRFAGMMQRQSMTMGGAWSLFTKSIEDNMTLIGTKLNETFNLADLATNATGFIDGFGAVITGLFGYIQEGVAVVQPVFEGFCSAVVQIWEAISGTGIYLWEQLSTAISGHAMSFISVVKSGLNYLAFGLKNFGDIAEIAGLSFILGLVKMYNNTEYFLTVAIPKSLQWFGENWRGLWNNLAEGTIAIFKNLFSNIVNIVKNLPGLISGKVSFADLWKPLFSGAQFEMIKSLDLPDRVKGQIENKLEGDILALSGKLGEKWDAHEEERRQKVLTEQAKKMGYVAEKKSPVNKDGSDYKKQTVAASAGKDQKLSDALQIGTKESNAAILRSVFGNKDDSTAKKTEKNTANTAKGIDKLGELFKNIKPVSDDLELA